MASGSGNGLGPGQHMTRAVGFHGETLGLKVKAAAGDRSGIDANGMMIGLSACEQITAAPGTTLRGEPARPGGGMGRRDDGQLHPMGNPERAVDAVPDSTSEGRAQSVEPAPEPWPETGEPDPHPSHPYAPTTPGAGEPPPGDPA